MFPQEVADLLTSRHPAIVAINRPIGPHLSPVWFLWHDNAFYFRVALQTAKYRNIKRDPSISLFLTDEEGSRYIAVSGEAQLLESNPRDLAVAIVEKYYAPTMAPYKMPPSEELDVVTIKLRPEKITTVVEEIAREAVASWLQ